MMKKGGYSQVGQTSGTDETLTIIKKKKKKKEIINGA